MYPKVLVVGSGLTGAVTGAILRKTMPMVNTYIWDSANTAGGRMSTIHYNDCGAVDLGAQYISATLEYKNVHKYFYDDLISTGILEPLNTKIAGLKYGGKGMEDYVMPSGSFSIVNHFLNNSKSEMKFNHHITEINEKGKQWQVCTRSGESDVFDAVVLTMPIPQMLLLSGDIKHLIEADSCLRQNLLTVTYSSRFALGLFFSTSHDLQLENESCAKYISDNEILRYVAIDHLKRNVACTYPSVVIHTSVLFGKNNIDKNSNEVKDIILSEVNNMFPHWPKPIEVICQQWKFSQVTNPYPGAPNCVSIADGLIVGGDGFSHSNMDGCIKSASAISQKISDYMKII